jgi:hypothetical protein
MELLVETDTKTFGVQRPAAPTGSSVRTKPISGMGRCTPKTPLPSCPPHAHHGDDPREPSTRARLPIRHKLYCEAPTGVADPKTTWPSEVDASTQEGG